jgi:hypothetical protein
MTALLIGGQFVLSQVGGIEIVTVLLLSYSYCFGAKKGACVAVCFSILRCFIYGFYLNVILLYLIYYPLFAIFWGTIGKKINNLGGIAIIAALCTLLFTCIDNIISPLFNFIIPGKEWNFKSIYMYWIASAPFALIQSACSVVTVALLFIPLKKVFTTINKAA